MRRSWEKAVAWLILLTGLSALSAAAIAQSSRERRYCGGEEPATLDQRIATCSAVIKAAHEKNEKSDAYNNRGLARRLKGEYERAIQDYNQAIKLNPNFDPAFNNRGVAYDSNGELDRALQDFDQAIRMKPSPEAYFNRGNVLLAKGQYAPAIDDYDRALKLQTDFAPAFDNRCWARAVLGALRQALADCNEALRLMPNHAATLESRAFIFLKTTQYDAAVSDFDTALKLDSKLAFALYGRGLAKLKNEDPAGEADILAAKALQTNIGEEFARYGMADAR